MLKCVKCCVDMKQGDLVAKCTGCNLEFHPSCTQLGPQKFTKLISKTWKCERCTLDANLTTDLSPTGVDKKTLIEVINGLKTDLQSHTDAAVDNVIKKLDSMNEEIQSLSNKYTKLDQHQNELEERCYTLEQDNTRLTDEVRSLSVRLQDTEQHSRCANIEVLGIPETPGEDMYAVLQKLAAALGVTYIREQVSIAHRLRYYSDKHAHPPIICQFVSRSVKEVWISAARKKRSIKSTDIAPNLKSSVVYVNDHLTANNKAILGKARRLQRQGKIHFAGFFNGKVLVKPRERDASVRIVHVDELNKFDGGS